MTKEEIIAIYIEVSNKLCNGTEWCWAGVDEPLQLFAKLVAAKEREECAKLCESMWHEWLDSPEENEPNKPDAEDCYRAIRRRGQE